MSIRLIHVNERRISLSEFDSEVVWKEVLEQVRIPGGLHVGLLVLQGVGKTTLALPVTCWSF